MGEVRLSYQLENFNIKPADLIGEIEYGITFISNADCDVPVYPQYKRTRWVNECEIVQDRLHLAIDDRFFSQNCIFDQLLITFLFNFLDFGGLQLEDVDFTKSDFKNTENPFAVDLSESIFLGTVLKPYYSPMKQKVEMLERFLGKGVRFIKEDETFLGDKQTILTQSAELQKVCGEDGYYIPNVTSFVNDHLFIKELIDECGIRIVMLDYLVCGLNNVANLKRAFPHLGLWGHRVGFLAVERNITIKALAQMAVVAGIDFLHIGTPQSRNEFNLKSELIKVLNKNRKIKAVFTKTTPETIGDLVNVFKGSAIYMACGSLRGMDGMSIDWLKVDEWVEETSE